MTGAKSGWLSIQAEGPGWLVTYQPWYPGWTATVDGAPVATEPVDGALTGLSLPPGAHRIELSYRPAWLEIGAGVSLVAGLALLGWLLWERRRSVPGDRSDGLAPIASSA